MTALLSIIIMFLSRVNDGNAPLPAWVTSTKRVKDDFINVCSKESTQLTLLFQYNL